MEEKFEEAGLEKREDFEEENKAKSDAIAEAKEATAPATEAEEKKEEATPCGGETAAAAEEVEKKDEEYTPAEVEETAEVEEAEPAATAEEGQTK